MAGELVGEQIDEVMEQVAGKVLGVEMGAPDNDPLVSWGTQLGGLLSNMIDDSK